MTYDEEIIASMVEHEDDLFSKMPPEKTQKIKFKIIKGKEFKKILDETTNDTELRRKLADL